jgi:glutamine synthetase
MTRSLKLYSPLAEWVRADQVVSWKPLSDKIVGSLDESLKALEGDQEFLLKGDVFTAELIESWIAYKREREIQPLRLRPHPLEFSDI